MSKRRIIETSLPFGLIFLLLSSVAWAQGQDQVIAVDSPADEYPALTEAGITIVQAGNSTECQHNGWAVCTGDAGDCQFRMALLCANAWSAQAEPETTKITFADLQRDEAIAPSMKLPVITADGLEIDGFTCVNCILQNGDPWEPSSGDIGASVTPQVIFGPDSTSAFKLGPTIDGSYHEDPGGGANVGSLLEVKADSVLIRGLHLMNSPQGGQSAAISFSNEALEDYSGSTVQGCFIGVSRNGLNPTPNHIGIRVQQSHTVISHNVISGNSAGGVVVYRGVDNQIRSNLIGVTIGGEALANEGGGIRLGGGGSTVEGIRIGGSDDWSGNLIAGNEGPGIYVVGDVEGGYIASNHIGGIAVGVGNVGPGILIEGLGLAPDIDVPRGLEIRGNEVVFNEGGGVRISGANDLAFLGNLIGVGADPAADDSNPDAVLTGINGDAAPAFLLLGDATGTTQGIRIGDDTVDNYNVIAANEASAVVIVAGNYDGGSNYGGGSAVDNQVNLNRYSDLGGHQIIDHVGWDNDQLVGEDVSEEQYRGKGGPCVDKWEGDVDRYGNRRTLAPSLNSVAVGESDGDFYLYASGMACGLVESLRFFVTNSGTDWTEPVIDEGDPLLVFADDQDALSQSSEVLASFFTLDGYGPIANVVEGDEVLVTSLIWAKDEGAVNSSEFSYAAEVVICTEKGVDADEDGVPGNACSGFSDPGSRDCDDEDAGVHPGATEWCDNDTDDDCDGAIDDDDPDGCVDPTGDDDDDGDDGDDDDSADEGAGYRPPGCVISCDLAEGASSHSFSALALMLAFATLRRRRELLLKAKAP